MTDNSECIICGQEMMFKYTHDYHPRCLVKLKEEKLKQQQTELCYICGQSILIQYSDHPGLHSTCYDKWKSTNEGEYPFPKVIFNEEEEVERCRANRERVNLEKKEKLTASFLSPEFIIDEEMDQIKRILSCKNLYEVLQVPNVKIVSQDYISFAKKQYKKIALKVHPDKNKDPNSERAFQILSSAVSCITDPEVKAKYDGMMEAQNVNAILVAMELFNNLKKFF